MHIFDLLVDSTIINIGVQLEGQCFVFREDPTQPRCPQRCTLSLPRNNCPPVWRVLSGAGRGSPACRHTTPCPAPQRPAPCPVGSGSRRPPPAGRPPAPSPWAHEAGGPRGGGSALLAVAGWTGCCRGPASRSPPCQSTSLRIPCPPPVSRAVLCPAMGVSVEQEKGRGLPTSLNPNLTPSLSQGEGCGPLNPA